MNFLLRRSSYVHASHSCHIKYIQIQLERFKIVCINNFVNLQLYIPKGTVFLYSFSIFWYIYVPKNDLHCTLYIISPNWKHHYSGCVHYLFIYGIQSNTSLTVLWILYFIKYLKNQGVKGRQSFFVCQKWDSRTIL